MKSPAVLLYTSDFLVGTDYFSDAEVGQYFRLLCYQHQYGHLSKDFINRKYPQGLFPEVKKKFKIDSHGCLYNQRMDDEINKRSDYAESRRKNVMSRWNKGDKPLSGKKIKEIHMNNITDGIHLDKDNVISWSFYQKLVNKCCGDKEQAARVIYRAKGKKSAIKWITAGLKKENPYALKSCLEEDTAPQKVRAWIDSNVFRIKNKSSNKNDCPESIGGILKGMI